MPPFGIHMALINIIKNRRPLTLHKAGVQPSFTSKTVLVTDTWDYVEMWLKRKRKTKALFHWKQARQFHAATVNLPKTSAALTAYYAFLNAAKVLLLLRNAPFAEAHGLAGRRAPGKVSLANERVVLQTAGIFPAFCRVLGYPHHAEKSHSLKAILYNLVYIHRAYNLTFRSQEELFIPIARPRFVRKQASKDAWFCFELEQRYAGKQTLTKLGKDYEHDAGVATPYTVRRRKRFSYDSKLSRVTDYHASIRKRCHFISGPTKLWYIKKHDKLRDVINLPPLALTIAAMHRLSELERYDPESLARHFDSQHNWLLSEFIATASTQFLDEISSEITGQEFMVPGRASRPS